ncbi:MAG TPA: hypothetical protein VF334_00990, partial [Polyangia bacterium]
QALFLGYLLHGHRGGDGKRLVDHFAESRGRDFGREVALAVRSLRETWASLFEVVEVHRGAGVALRDLIAGDAVRVSDVSVSESARCGDWMFAWVLPVGDRLQFVGTLCGVPDDARSGMVEALREEDDGGGRDRSALAPFVRDMLLDAIEATPMPAFVTGDGDELMFCSAHYAVRDEAALRRWLTSAPQLDRINDNAWVWLEDDRYLARIDLGGDGSLRLESNSRDRLERAKQLLASDAASLVEHRLDSVQDPKSAMRASRGERRGRDEIPDDVKREMMAAVLQQHYATWADVPLPALDGKTPRQAARSQRGRAQVRALVDDIERGTLAQPGGDTVDFDAMREELGLDDEPEADGDYDAGNAPDAKVWLELDADERMQAVRAFHRRLQTHPPMPNARMHALVHVIVENQVALGDPKETSAALERLCDAGLSRHEALHAVGEVIAGGIAQVMRREGGVDRDSMIAELVKLRPGRHAGSAPR